MSTNRDGRPPAIEPRFLERRPGLVESIRRCAHLIGPGQRNRWLGLMVLAIIVSGLESSGAALVFSLIAMVTEGREALELPLVGDVHDLLPDLGFGGPVLTATVVVAVFFVVRAVMSIMQAYLQNRVANNAGARLSGRLLTGYLSMPWEFHLGRSSAELIRNAYDTVQVLVREVFVPSTRMVSEAFMVAGLSVVMLVTAPLASVMAFAILGPVLFVLLRFVHPRLKQLGATSQRSSMQSLSSLQQSLHGVRDIKLLGRERFFEREFTKRRYQFARAQYLRTAAREVPHVILELVLVLFTLGFLTVAVVSGQSASALPVLGLFAYVALRIQPALNKIVSGLNSLKFAAPAIDQLYEDVTLVEGVAAEGGSQKALPDITFEHQIHVRSVSYFYPGTERPALDGVDLTIAKGESLGVVGPTGGGKSTLVDVLLGLLTPTEGEVLVDGVDVHSAPATWQRHLGVVHQAVFLVDDTLRRNIAFGVDEREIDEHALAEAIRTAQLETFVDELPDGLETVVGERGLRLSGGQRQRVAIARAVYRKPRVLVFDEGTSALDSVTEAAFIQALDASRQGRTLITVAHRLNTVRDCDRIALVQEGRLVDVASYDTLLDRCDAFRGLATQSPV